MFLLHYILYTIIPTHLYTYIPSTVMPRSFLIQLLMRPGECVNNFVRPLWLQGGFRRGNISISLPSSSLTPFFIFSNPRSVASHEVKFPHPIRHGNPTSPPSPGTAKLSPLPNEGLKRGDKQIDRNKQEKVKHYFEEWTVSFLGENSNCWQQKKLHLFRYNGFLCL